MKTITFKQKKNLVTLQWLILALLVLAVNPINAQFQNNGLLFIGDQGYIYLAANTKNFASTGAVTKTTRTAGSRGKIVFGSGATASGASDNHFLDGYTSVLSTAPFIAPVGQSGSFAPAQITASTVDPVDVAYYKLSSTTIGGTLDASVSLISSKEYWNIDGTNNATISLTWRSSSVVSDLVTSTADLTIAGYDGSKWVAIPSTVDATSILGGSSTLTTGSISSNTAVDINTIKFFSLAAKSAATCLPLIASSGVTKTWNGAWLPSAPTLADPVVIDAAYPGISSEGSFACNSLLLNANVTLANGQNIEVINSVTGTGKIIMASQATLVQRSAIATAPNIELTKQTRGVMRQFDYIYWGTPITGNFASQLADAQASTATTASAFDAIYKYQSGAGGGWQLLTTTETGKGFITRIKPQAPFTSSSATDFINLKFTGQANNGDITVPIARNPANTTASTSHVLLANPYPSAIDANEFLTANTTIDGVVYLWTAATLNNGTGQLYSQADYLAYTLAGATVPSGIATTFDGKIASGQGFKVRSNVDSGNVTFTNCMRLLANNNQFYKIKQVKTATKDRFKLNMTGGNGVFSQILIAYLPNTTLGYDRLYDAGRNSVSTAQLYSRLDSDGTKLAINARPSFNPSDIVNLGLSKTTSIAEDFSISIAEKEGVFADLNTAVYLHDTELNIYHDFSTGAYNFTTISQENNNRFKIVYQAKTLDTDQFDAADVIADIKNNTLTLKANKAMVNVAIFDLTGKKLYESKVDNATAFSAAFYKAQAVYIAKVTLENGTTANVKLINQK